MTKNTEKFTVRNRWSGEVQFTAEIAVTPDMITSVKLGLAVKWGRDNDANLSDANLSDAYLSGANLSSADLSGANLRDANLRGAPKIDNIHQRVYEAASTPGALDMDDWHRCDTTHCRAGWVTTLAGEAGLELESRIGTPAAATLIYLASDPNLERIPDFYCGNETALEDMKRLADAEKAAGAVS